MFRLLTPFLIAVSLVLGSGHAPAQETEPAPTPSDATPAPAPTESALEPAPALPTPQVQAAEPQSPDDVLVPNTDPANGPPDEKPPSDWYVDKEDSPYFDVVGAWGWQNDAFLLTGSLLNMYLHEDGDTFGFHCRFFAMGVLSFEKRMIAADGSSHQKRRTTFLLELIDPFLRIYVLGPMFVAVGLNVGMAFYDGMVPVLEPQAGLGFAYGGWGLEAGMRLSRLPREATMVEGNEFVHLKYGWLVYAGIETNLP